MPLPTWPTAATPPRKAQQLLKDSLGHSSVLGHVEVDKQISRSLECPPGGCERTEQIKEPKCKMCAECWKQGGFQSPKAKKHVFGMSDQERPPQILGTGVGARPERTGRPEHHFLHSPLAFKTPNDQECGRCREV